jgi:hypothetical protein
MKQVAHKFSTFVLYYDHHNHVARNSYFKDIVLNPVAIVQGAEFKEKWGAFPGSKVRELPDFYKNLHRECDNGAKRP